MEGYKHFCAMLDCSRDGVMRPEEVKRFASVLHDLGYDSVMLYTEDTYEVEGEPWFGYMRGGYTTEEIRSIDASLKELGMELIPCIQTLAHFTTLTRLPHYADIVDVDDILLIGEEKTYELIDRMFASLAKAFSSRLINIGMDEAHRVGLGKYLDRHGYADRIDLLLNHLNRVCAIAEKYGFRPIMWSDMFFRLVSHGEYGPSPLPEEVKSLIPGNVSLAYWDYYHKTEEHYDTMLKAHSGLGREVWFAGGAWTWMGFAPMNGYSSATMSPAMRSVRKNGVEHVLITMWGDNGKECSFYAALPALYEISCRARGIEDERAIKEGFEKQFHIPFDEFSLLDLPNHRSAGDPLGNENLCKSLFYSDPFMGYFDASLDFSVDYEGYAERISRVRAGKYGYLFEFYTALCRFLALKYSLGVRTRRAYREKNREELLSLGEKTYPQAADRLEKFYRIFREVWLKENKPFGLEVHEARMGGLMLRLRSCGSRLAEYARGGEPIEELEREVLPVSKNGALTNNFYTMLVSFGTL